MTATNSSNISAYKAAIMNNSMNGKQRLFYKCILCKLYVRDFFRCLIYICSQGSHRKSFDTTTYKYVMNYE